MKEVRCESCRCLVPEDEIEDGLCECCYWDLEDELYFDEMEDEEEE